MTRAAHDTLVRVTEAFRGFFDELDALGIERGGGAFPVRRDLGFQPSILRDLAEELADFARHRVDLRIVGMTQIDAERNAPGDRVTR